MERPLNSSYEIFVRSTVRGIPLSLESAQSVLEFLLKENRVLCNEMALHFVGKTKISHLHELYFQDPTPTDCITLPYCAPSTPSPSCLGELFVCPLVAKEYVKKSGGDLYREITLYTLHGFLHLIGFDDIKKTDREKMRNAEAKWMDALEKNGLGITP